MFDYENTRPCLSHRISALINSTLAVEICDLFGSCHGLCLT